MKPVLFLIHGIGNHNESWAEPITEKLNNVSKRYKKLKAKDKHVKDLIDFRPISYDHFFRQQLSRWQSDVQALRENAEYGYLKDGIEWLGGYTEDSFVWSHVADVLLFMLEPVRSAVISYVTEQIKKGIVERDDGSQNFHVLAHSLGTAVATYALHNMNVDPPGGESPYKDGNFKFGNVFMVSNTSRLLQTEPSAYDTKVKSGLSNSKRANCLNYWNISHTYDPIPKPRAFRPQHFEAGYHVVEVSHSYQRNIHSLEHYCEHPGAHVPVLRTIDPALIPGNEYQVALDAYRDPTKKQFGGDFQDIAQVAQLKEDLKEFDLGDWDDINKFKSFLKYFANSLKVLT